MIDRNAIIVGIATILFIIFGLYYGNFLRRSFAPPETIVEELPFEVVPTVVEVVPTVDETSLEPSGIATPTPSISPTQ